MSIYARLLLVVPAMESLPQNVQEFLQSTVVWWNPPVGKRDSERPVVREAQEETCDHDFVGDRYFLATRECGEPSRQALPQVCWAAGYGARQRFWVERRVRHDSKGQRDDLGEISS